uniref:Inhibitor of growth protein N-terminal histone-binding domain-containing protein n=1 Tax=Auxenochlorella protothecoides TaxID=3075 RepID=A0A1D1ZRI2_AUXPR
MAADQVIYLEKFIESTVHVPPELQRLLNTIKDLDERSEDLGAQIQDNVEVGLQGKLSKEQARELLERIEADQKLLVQFAEEKVQLAMQGYDLLDIHLLSLDADAAALAEELQANASLNDAFGPDAGFGGNGGAFDDPGTAPRTARLRDLSSYDSLEAVTDVKPGRRSTLGLSRQPSEDAMTPLAYDGGAGMAGGRRPQSSAGRRTPLTSMLGPLPGGETGGSSHIPKRRAASAAVHAAAAAVAAMDEDEGMEGNPPAIPGVVPVMPFATPLIPGFEHAAEQPQAPGRLLMASDIGPGLVGRRAELYWPDNNLWYLIEIRAVNLGSRTASILYTTGEVEELDLDEIVKEGHLSLITPIRAGPGR